MVEPRRKAVQRDRPDGPQTDLTGGGSSRTAKKTELSQADWNKARDEVYNKVKFAYVQEVKKGIDGEVAKAEKMLEKTYKDFPGLVSGAFKMAIEEGWGDGRNL